MLPIPDIHEHLKTTLGLTIVRGGQDLESLPLPFVTYDLIIDNRRKDHQIESTVLSDSVIEYKTISYQTYQYTIVSSGAGSEIGNALSRLENFYNHFLTFTFKNTLTKLGVSYKIVTPITELSVAKEMFFERQHIFEVEYGWTETFTSTSPGYIETVDSDKVAPPSNL